MLLIAPYVGIVDYKRISQDIIQHIGKPIKKWFEFHCFFLPFNNGFKSGYNMVVE